MKKLAMVAAVLILGTGEVQAAFWSEGNFSGLLVYRNTYDSNLLRYSPRDRDRFLAKTELYSPIHTLDDIRTDLNVSATYKFKIRRKLDSELRASGNFAHHLMNPIKNFGWISLTADQELSKKWTASFNYFYEPTYYIRDYNDVHTKSHQHCEFALGQWKGDASFRPVRAWEFDGFGKFKRYAYNEYFTEYDGDLIEFGGATIYRSKLWRISGGYSFAVNKNVGFSSTIEYDSSASEEDSELGQSDYEEDSYNFSVRRNFRVVDRRAWAQLDVEINDRYYTTDRRLDPIHYDRHDLATSTELSLRLYLNRKVRVEVGAAHYSRNSSASAPVVSRLKDYTRWTGWLEVGYEFPSRL